MIKLFWKARFSRRTSQLKKYTASNDANVILTSFNSNKETVKININLIWKILDSLFAAVIKTVNNSYSSCDNPENVKIVPVVYDLKSTHLLK